MKVNQIVNEHKKGVKAHVYTRKTKGTVPLYGPEKQEAKMTPYKPVKPSSKPIKETDEGSNVTTEPMPGAQKIEVDGQQIGTADQATANAITQAAQKGALTLNKPGQTPVGESHMSEVDELYNDWISSEYAPMDDDSGDDRIVMRKAMQFLRGQVNPHHVKDIAQMFTQNFHGGGDFDESVMQESANRKADDELLAKMKSIAGLK